MVGGSSGAVLQGEKAIHYSSVRDQNNVLEEGVDAILIALRRTAHVIARLATTHPTILCPYSQEEIMANILDQDKAIVFEYIPQHFLHDDASGGAAYFLGLVSLFTGLKLRSDFVATGVATISGALREVRRSLGGQ